MHQQENRDMQIQKRNKILCSERRRKMSAYTGELLYDLHSQCIRHTNNDKIIHIIHSYHVNDLGLSLFVVSPSILICEFSAVEVSIELRCGRFEVKESCNGVSVCCSIWYNLQELKIDEPEIYFITCNKKWGVDDFIVRCN